MPRLVIILNNLSHNLSQNMNCESTRTYSFSSKETSNYSKEKQKMIVNKIIIYNYELTEMYLNQL
jgi:hypothetical protein